MAALIRWDEDLPPLGRPILVTALEGFVDAGLAASTAATFLRHRWLADRCATFDRDAFLDYRARRPTAVVDGGELRRLEWPGVEMYAAVVDGPHDVVLLLGAEPDMRWEAFSATVVEACERLGVEASVSLGAYPAAVPHTRPTRVVAASTPGRATLTFDTGAVSGYTGPVGAATALQASLGMSGLPSTGLWAEVPHYISGSPNPAAALALVRTVSAALDTNVETTELDAAAKLHREQIDEAVSEHEDAGLMVEALERHYDSGEDDDELPTGEQMADEIEKFLRTQSD
jgi:predicted ATP-grasp superfamily ATP-dependent carboligase